MAFLTAFYLMIHRHMRYMERSDAEWLELMRQYLYSRYDYQYQQQTQEQQPQQQTQEQPQQQQRRLRLYDEDAAVDVAQQRRVSTSVEPPPFPYAVDIFGRVLTCPKCRVERGEVVPLMILHRDDGGNTMTCGRQDATGKLHLYRLVDSSASVAPVIEASAVASAIAETAAKKKKKKEQQSGEE